MKDLFLHLGGLPIGQFYYKPINVSNPHVFRNEENQNGAHEKIASAF